MLTTDVIESVLDHTIKAINVTDPTIKTVGKIIQLFIF